MGPTPSRHTYVDRGDLDRRVRAALADGTHVVMHGESKHGKSWLRAKTLPASEIARVQCVPGMTAGEILEQALSELDVNEPIRVTVESSTEAKLRSGGKLSVRVAEIGGEDEFTSGLRHTVEEQPVGHNRRDLGWVARHFRAKDRTPVFEDFHNLDPEVQYAMAYVIKALGEWNVPCVISGIWTDTHLLKLYNGELDGRIVDLKLRWQFEELEMVVQRGCRALNVETSDRLARTLVKDAYTSVGLLQELMKATLAAAGVRRRNWRRRQLDDTAALAAGREQVVDGIASRFDPFIQRLPSAVIDGVRPTVYPALTAIVTHQLSESVLLEGVPLADLHRRILVDDAGVQIEDVRRALESIESAQRSVSIKPSVLAFDAARERLILADRRLLLYLRERPPR
jgi:hypothetical protein